jgi:hypothetical protein
MILKRKLRCICYIIPQIIEESQSEDTAIIDKYDPEEFFQKVVENKPDTIPQVVKRLETFYQDNGMKFSVRQKEILVKAFLHMTALNAQQVLRDDTPQTHYEKKFDLEPSKERKLKASLTEIMGPIVWVAETDSDLIQPIGELYKKRYKILGDLVA